MIDSSKMQDGRKRELSAAEVDAVSGGLNPQPLPPRWSVQAWNIRALNVLKFANFNFRQVF